jgi:hypothetical protein
MCNKYSIFNINNVRNINNIMIIVSYDVASKSLALSIIKFNNNWETDLEEIMKKFKMTLEKNQTELNSVEICELALQCISDIKVVFDTLITPLFFDVVDLIPGKKLKNTTPALRASRLRAYLYSVDKLYLNGLIDEFPDDDLQVLLEYQMGPNDKSRNVGSQILYHYSPFDTGFKSTNSVFKSTNSVFKSNKLKEFAIDIVGPSLKNKLNMYKPLSFFIEKYAKKYDANKKHSKDTFLYWVKHKKIESMISNIPKKNLDDIADSVNMTLAWIFIKHQLA